MVNIRLKKRKKESESFSRREVHGLARYSGDFPNNSFPSKPFQHVGKVKRKVWKPFWLPECKPSQPAFWIEDDVDAYDNLPIFRMDHKGLPVYNNRLFDIELSGKELTTFVDTGSFKCLMPPWVKEELFPNEKVYQVYISGIARRPEKKDFLRNIPFYFNGHEFRADFVIIDNLEDIFGAQIVIGRSTFNEILRHFYGISFEGMFDFEKINSAIRKKQHAWIESKGLQVFHVDKAKTIFTTSKAEREGKEVAHIHIKVKSTLKDTWRDFIQTYDIGTLTNLISHALIYMCDEIKKEMFTAEDFRHYIAVEKGKKTEDIKEKIESTHIKIDKYIKVRLLDTLDAFGFGTVTDFIKFSINKYIKGYSDIHGQEKRKIHEFWNDLNERFDIDFESFEEERKSPLGKKYRQVKSDYWKFKDSVNRWFEVSLKEENVKTRQEPVEYPPEDTELFQKYVSPDRPQKKVMTVAGGHERKLDIICDAPIFLDNYALYQLYHYYKKYHKIPDCLLAFLKGFRFIVFDKKAVNDIHELEPALTRQLLDISNKLFNITHFIFRQCLEEYKELGDLGFGAFEYGDLYFPGVYSSSIFMLGCSEPQHICFWTDKLAVLTLPSPKGQVDRLELYSYLRKKAPEKSIVSLDINDILFHQEILVAKKPSSREQEDKISEDSLSSVLAVKPGSTVISRTFSLIPDEDNALSRISRYKEITDLLVKVRALKNKYVHLMVRDIENNGINSYQYTSMSRVRQAVYDRLNFSHVKSPQFQSYELKERAKQCAFYSAYLVVRNWLIRAHNLERIAKGMIQKFTKDNDFTLDFLRGKRFRQSDIQDILNLVNLNCFGKFQPFSTFFLNNHIYQLRNIFLKQNDILVSDIVQKVPLTNPLQNNVKKIFDSLKLSNIFLQKVENGFYKTEKKKPVQVPPSELPEYLLNQYFRKIKWITTKKAQRIIALRKKLQKEQNKKKKASIERSLEYELQFLEKLIGVAVDFDSMLEFKKKRDGIYNSLKGEFSSKLGREHPQKLISEAFDKELQDFKDSHNQYVLKRIFKPHFPSISVDSVSYDSFAYYVTKKLQYKIRELLKDYFTSKSFISLMGSQLRAISQDIFSHLRLPEHKALSISIVNKDVYKPDYANFSTSLRLVSHKFKSFKIKDKKIINQGGIKKTISRIQNLKQKGFEPLLPVINLKHRKLLLNLPFQKLKKESLKPSEYDLDTVPNPDIVMGVDLGLKHFAVVSIRDKRRKRELSRYFLGPHQLFDQKFSSSDGKIYMQDRFAQAPSDKLSNVKLKLINLRAQIRLLQRKKNKYEQNLLAQGVVNFRKKLKWNKIQKSISLCWERLNRLNLQIVRYLNHYLTEIAKFWRVSTVKVEDLRWATHSKKRDVGKFLSFWQTHWFYSQVQSAVELQCKLNGIEFQKVSARYTSQDCSKCGARGLRDRKHFSCPNGHRLDSDLNAARNIAQA